MGAGKEQLSDGIGKKSVKRCLGGGRSSHTHLIILVYYKTLCKVGQAVSRIWKETCGFFPFPASGFPIHLCPWVFINIRKCFCGDFDKTPRAAVCLPALPPGNQPTYILPLNVAFPQVKLSMHVTLHLKNI